MRNAAICLVSLAATLSCRGVGVASDSDGWQQVAELAAPEAIQAAAADDRFVYAIASRQVAKYHRATGQRIGISSGGAQHLNSGFLWNGKLLCAHSNYPQMPERSEIKALDPESMLLSTFRDFGNLGGSLTWVVRHDDYWWCNFARYGDKNAETFLVAFDDDWIEKQRWTYPKAVIDRLGRYSLSGGLWCGHELLVTGHDNPEFYRLRLPNAGSVLEFVGQQSVPFTGQGFAKDFQTDGFVGINRARRRVIFVRRRDNEASTDIRMPTRGICAHRGASDSHPENTLAAFREAIRLGAQMIEFDVALSRDQKLVLMHDVTVDRTTDGTGAVSELTLTELRKLDAGSWKHGRFGGERIPTLGEALAIMPENIWLNVHLKGGAELAMEVTQRIVASNRVHQAFLACGTEAARAAKSVDARIRICNMERQANSQQYVDETIDMQAEFIQLLGGGSVDPMHTKRLSDQGIRINFCCANEADTVDSLFRAGVEFPLVDRVAAMLEIADHHDVKRLQPVYRSTLRHAGLETPLSRLIERRPLKMGAAEQGMALTATQFFTSTSRSVFRYDTDWNLLEEKPIRIEGVNHIGAIDHHDGILWAGLLHGPKNGKHDPRLNRSIIAKIRTSDLTVVRTWDITKDVTWIDPVCFDGRYLWVGDLSDLGIHRYRFDGDEIIRDGVFRYPTSMHFSQGIRVVGNKLYTIHTFGDMDGLFRFDLPDRLTDEIQRPSCVWQIVESRMHLEGFDFVPGAHDQIWHAQGNQVDRYVLNEPASVAAATRITHGPFIGHVSSDSATIWARFSQPGEYQLTARVAQSDSFVRAVARTTRESDGCIHWNLDQLTPGTRYDYQIEFDGEHQTGRDAHFFETAGSPNSALVRLTFASCAREDDSSAAVWRRMRNVNPHAVVLLGDTPYIDSTDLDIQRRRYREFAAVPDFRNLLRNRSLYATWDDHDFGRNDTDGNVEGKQNSRRAFIEFHANPSYGDGRTGIYTKFRRGGVEVFLLDTRFFAATEPSPFDGKKLSLLGQSQWQWLQHGLKSSTAPFKVLACGMIWNGAVRPGKQDHWATYPYERDALFDFIGQEQITGVVLVGGDIHRTRVLHHQSTERAGYRIPELITSPVHSGVIATANAPHPGLIHDSGTPNTFLLLTVDNRDNPATLDARFLDKDGLMLFELKLTEQDLHRRNGDP